MADAGRALPRGGGTWLAWSVLAAGLALTALAAARESRRAEERARQDLLSRALEIRTRIVAGLESLEALLRGAASYIDASEHVSRAEFHAYVVGLRMGTRYPGIQGLGFVRAFPCSRRAEAADDARADGPSDFRPWPEPEPGREACSAVLWIEPCEGRNVRALGYDGLSEPVRRATFDRARDRDETALSARIVLVQESGEPAQAGALIAVPVYHGGRPGPELGDRRGRLEGWVYAVLRMDDFVHGIFGAWLETESGRLRLRIWDGAVREGTALVWDGSTRRGDEASGAGSTLPVTFGGHAWTLGLDPGEPGVRAYRSRTALVSVSGSAVSALLFALLVSLRRLRLLNEELETRVAARTRDLDASAAELRAFAYTVAHDLKAPLRAVSGFATLVLEEKEEHLDAESRRLLGRVVDAARAGGLLIEGLLRHAALAHVPLKRGPVDLTATARSVVAEFEAGGPERRVVWAIAPGLSADADAALLREALVCLLGNAWKFTAERDPARIEVDADTGEGETVYRVRDDGAGFDPAHAHRLFQPFQRAHAPGLWPGVGIGLAIAARIVRRHGGWIRIDGAPGKGASVRFTLAARRP